MKGTFTPPIEIFANTKHFLFPYRFDPRFESYFNKMQQICGKEQLEQRATQRVFGLALLLENDMANNNFPKALFQLYLNYLDGWSNLDLLTYKQYLIEVFNLTPERFPKTNIKHPNLYQPNPELISSIESRKDSNDIWDMIRDFHNK